MIIKINNVALAESPKEFRVTIVDLDDGESSVRTLDGTLTRDRVAVKRQIAMSWGVLKWSIISSILTSMTDTFFEVYYPDPLTGGYETKTFYVGDRPVPTALSKDGEIYWNDVSIILVEQ